MRAGEPIKFCPGPPTPAALAVHCAWPGLRHEGNSLLHVRPWLSVRNEVRDFALCKASHDCASKRCDWSGSQLTPNDLKDAERGSWPS